MVKGTKKKDILFLLQFFYPEYISSATLPFDTAVKFSQQGFSVDVLCGYPKEYSEKNHIPLNEVVENINIRRVKYLQMDRKKKLGRLINYLSLTIAMFFRLFSLRKYDTIFVYSNPPILPIIAAWASKLFGCKLVFVAYDLYPEIAIKTNSLSKDSMISKVMNYINKNVFNSADAVVALSSEMKEYIIENRAISEEKVFVIPNWYRDEYVEDKKANNNSFSEIVNGRFVVGYFGNMGVAQDMEIIKEAIRFYKNDRDVCFILSGHGTKHGEVEKLIKEENIENAYLYGFLKGQEYLDALRISDCAIVSLEKDLTGLCVPSKTYGYMMQGLPIVAIMGESDIAKDTRKGAGFHIIDNSMQELIDVIDYMKNNKQECNEKRKNSRDIYLKNYTPEINLGKYIKMFEAIHKEN